MSYLVLARKYRPQTFEDLVGQKHVTRTLTGAISSGRVAQGYLFTGTRGVGKTTVARILAKALNCEKGPTPQPCNVCSNCLEITRGGNVDVAEIDGASNNSVDDVRDMREKINFLPQKSRYRIIIIDEVHMLSKPAFNALLKTLEEPPEHIVFIFATTDAAKIPETILSRVQQYDFKTISLKEILEHLRDIATRENLSLTDDHLMLIARKAEGSLRDALSYMDQAVSFAGENLSARDLAEVLGVMDRSALLELSAAILAGRPDETLEILARFSEVAWDVKQLFADILEHFRNLVVARVARSPEKMIDATPEDVARLSEQSKVAGYETLEHLFSILLESEDEIRSSAYPRLVLEMVLVRMSATQPIQPLDELAREIGKLRRDLAGGRTGAGGAGQPPRTGAGSRQSAVGSRQPAGGSYQSAVSVAQPPLASAKRYGEPGPVANQSAVSVAQPPLASAKRYGEAGPVADKSTVGSSQSAARVTQPPPTVANVAQPPPVAKVSNAATSVNGAARTAEGFLQAVRARDIALAATLRRNGSVEVEGGRVDIRAPGGFALDSLQERRELLRGVAGEVFGDEATLNIFEQEVEEEPEPLRAQASEKVRREQAAEMRRTAMQNPLVRLIHEKFSGSEMTVVPLDSLEEESEA